MVWEKDLSLRQRMWSPYRSLTTVEVHRAVSQNSFTLAAFLKGQRGF